MKNELLHIGPFTVYGYGLMIGMGILAAWSLACIRAKRQRRDPDHLFLIALWILIGGFICAKLMFLATQIPQFLRDPSLLRYYLSDGFVVYGGILGGIFSCWLLCRRKRWNFLSWFDFLMPSVALGQSFGRIGCFLAGCCYGKETSGPFSVVFESSAYAPNGIPLIPTQIWSAGLDLALVVLLLMVDRIKDKDGVTASVYLIAYSIGRFWIEFFRGDERGSVGFLSTSQMIACFTLLAGFTLAAYTRRGK